MIPIGEDYDRYRVSPSTDQQFGEDHRIVRSHTTGTSMILPSETYDWLKSCRSFKSLDEYVGERITRWVRNEMTQNGVLRGTSKILVWTLLDLFRKSAAAGSVRGNVSKIRQQIDELVQAGMFMSRMQLLRRLQVNAEDHTSGAAIRIIAIPAARHPQLAARCLAGFMENQAAHGRKVRFWVGSSDSESSDQSLFAQLARRYGMELTWPSIMERVSFAQRLAQQIGLSYDLVSFAILGEAGRSTGVDRNAALLANHGEPFLSVDEDMLCEPFSRDTTNDLGGCVWDSSFDPRTFRFFADLAAAKASLKAHPIDVISAHERLLGRSVHALARACVESGTIELDRADESFVEDVWWGRGQILLAMTGVVGPSHVHWSMRFLEMPENCRAQLLGSEGVCRMAAESRAVAAAVCSPTISNGAYVSSKCFALDNRIPFPPFMPGLRDDGILFGTMLRCCHEHAYTGLLPSSLVHDPPATSQEQPSALLWPGTRLDLSYYLSRIFEEIDLRSTGSNPAARLGAMGRHLTVLAQEPVCEFTRVIRRLFLARTTALLASLESVLRPPRSSTTSRTEQVRRHMDALRNAILREDAAVPREFCALSRVEEAWDEARRTIHKYGQLLEAWPAIVECAGTLREHSDGLAPARHRPT